jgi:predicted TIM-barrel fold metal-dependent hydrolase
VELLKPVGVKLYPNTFVADQVKGWRMDDPEIAFPVFERARKLGLKVVAIHKAVPMGPVPMDVYKVDDIDRAAIAFPELNFEIVHGGAAFVEETAWQLARFKNVWVNLEITSAMLIHAPGQFHDAMFNLVKIAQEHVTRRIMWGTGCMAIHPRPALERFVREFRFNDATVEQGGVRQITAEDKRRILFDNYAEMVGLDLASRLPAIRNDEFAKRRGAGAPAAPYSTTASAGRAE